MLYSSKNLGFAALLNVVLLSIYLTGNVVTAAPAANAASAKLERESDINVASVAQRGVPSGVTFHQSVGQVE